MESKRANKSNKSVNFRNELFDYFKNLPNDFWGIIQVKFKDGHPYLVEETRQIKLGPKVQK